jgi:N-acetylglucosaminyldiphosphoundecaprenol N-acetyl-beta-D-mannosaminyltransferase
MSLTGAQLVKFDRLRCCGVDIDAAPFDGAVDAIIASAIAGDGGAVHLCNAYTLSIACQDPAFSEMLGRAQFNFPDGMPLVWLARRRGIQLESRVYGPDLMATVCDRGREVGLRHYLYGSTPEVLAALETRLRERYEGIEIVGSESPPFRDLLPEELDEAAARFKASGAHVAWIGLGTPKQDWFTDEMASRTSVQCVAVGAAFDFHAGTVRQAPAWIQERGLEWAYRLMREPRRLWRRYLIGNVVFLAGTLRVR